MLWHSMEASQCAIVNEFFLDENIIKDLFNPKDRFLYGPQGLQPGKTQSSLFCYRDLLEY